MRELARVAACVQALVAAGQTRQPGTRRRRPLLCLHGGAIHADLHAVGGVADIALDDSTRQLLDAVA